MSLSKEKLQKLIEFYKKSFVEHWSEEKYKWQAIKHFQENWDMDAADFKMMFEEATRKTSNLLAAQNYYPAKIISGFAEYESMATRNMFAVLFDESKKLSERIEFFKNEADRIRMKYDSKLKKSNGKGWENHFQTENAISTYLWLRYPNKYYIYKWSEYRNVARELDSSVKFTKGRKENLENGFALYDAICEELSKDEELKKLLKIKLTDDCYPDDALKTLTIDFGFNVSRYYNDNQWIPENYTTGISKEQWKKLVLNENVFTKESLITFACMHTES